MRKCKDCGIEKDESEFYQHRRPNGEQYIATHECKKCCCKRTKAYHDKNLEKQRLTSKLWWEKNKKRCNIKRKEQRLQYYYGISIEGKENLLKDQEYKCKSCGYDLKNEKPYHIHLDHDHKTGKIRGILCRSCNIALGLMEDNPEKIMSLYNYILSFKEDNLSQ